MKCVSALVDYAVIILIAVIGFGRTADAPVAVSAHESLSTHAVSVALASAHFAGSLGTEGVAARVSLPPKGTHLWMVGATRPKGAGPTLVCVIRLPRGLASKAQRQHQHRAQQGYLG